MKDALEITAGIIMFAAAIYLRYFFGRH